MKHAVKVSTPEQRAAAKSLAYVTFSKNEKELKFKYDSLAREWLRKNGWKFVASRIVMCHRERQAFYAKSLREYDRGDYAQLSTALTD